MGDVSTTTHILGAIYHPFGNTWYSLHMHKIW